MEVKPLKAPKQDKEWEVREIEKDKSQGTYPNRILPGSYQRDETGKRVYVAEPVSTAEIRARKRKEHSLVQLMLVKGLTLERMAVRMGVDVKTMNKMVYRALEDWKHTRTDRLEHQMVLEEQRLDYLWRKCVIGVEEGDIKCISEARRISGERRKLLGLDAPTKISISSVDELMMRLPDDIRGRIIECLAQLASGAGSPGAYQAIPDPDDIIDLESRDAA